MPELRKIVRKYHVGGIAALSDSRIPKPMVELYLRDAHGDCFYAATLEEAIHHLLSKDGYRLGIKEWPDGAGMGKPHYGITIRRDNDDLVVALDAPMIHPMKTIESGLRGESKAHIDLDWYRNRPTPKEVAENVTVVPIPLDALVDAEGSPVSPPEPDPNAPLYREVEVVISGDR